MSRFILILKWLFMMDYLVVIYPILPCKTHTVSIINSKGRGLMWIL